ncbi:MAG: tetratricopeptide repeat protein [Bdellovibrionota bacterium]
MHYDLDDYKRYGVRGLQRIAACQPDNVDARFKLGLALMDEREWEQAIAAFRSALELEPDHAAARCYLGRSLFELGQFDESTKELGAGMLGMSRGDYRHLTWFGESLEASGQVVGARDVYFQALRNNEGYPPAHAGLTRLSLVLDLELPRPENFTLPDVDVDFDVSWPEELVTGFHIRGEGIVFGVHVHVFRRESVNVVVISPDRRKRTDVSPHTRFIFGPVIEHFGLSDKDLIWFEVSDVGTLQVNRTTFGNADLREIGSQIARGVDFQYSYQNWPEFEAVTGFRLFWIPPA